MLTEDRRVGSLERMLHLRKAPIIGTLPANHLAVVAEAARPRVFRAGDALLHEDERVASATFIIDGRVRLERAGRPIGTLGPGAGLGAIGLLAGTTAVWTARAETDTLVLELDADSFFDLLEDHFDILRHFMRETCRQVIEYWRALPPGTPPLTKDLRPADGALRDLDLVERIFFLRQIVPFGRAGINALAELARGFSEVHLQPGARLWEEGDPARHVLLVVDGFAHCESRSGFSLEGGRGVSLGALETVAGLPRWYDAVVQQQPLTALSGDIEMLFDVFEDNLEMALQFQAAMSQWALALTHKLTELQPERLAELAGVVAGPVAPD